MNKKTNKLPFLIIVLVIELFILAGVLNMQTIASLIDSLVNSLGQPSKAHLQESQEYQAKFDNFVANNSYQKEFAVEVYYSEPYIAGFISMYEASQDEKYIEQTLADAEGMIGRLKDTDGDGFLEWLSAYGKIRCISTERATMQLARLARIIKNDNYLNSKYGDRADNIIKIIKKDVINNPGCKSRFEKDNYNKLGVLHIISKPTLILLELYLIEGNVKYLDDKSYTYLDTIKSNSLAMKKALKTAKKNNASLYLWGAVWCKELNETDDNCYTLDDAKPCLNAQGERLCGASDTSHAQDFVFVAIELYRAGIVFTRNDINLLGNTFVNNIWNGDSKNPKYKDFINGNLESKNGYYYKRYGSAWTDGSGIAPGWVGLGAFSRKIQNIIRKGDSSSITNKTWLNPLAYYGELARNTMAGICRYTNSAKEIEDKKDNDCDGRIDE